MFSEFSDDHYRRAGAIVVPTAEETWSRAQLLVKVKEPISSEYGFLREDLTLFTYLHLAADRPLTEAIIAAVTTAIAYKTVQTDRDELPLLAPMSEVAGRLSIVVGAYVLLSTNGGQGLIIGGIPGTPKSEGGRRRRRC